MTEPQTAEIVDLQVERQTPQLSQREYKILARAIDTHETESRSNETSWATLYPSDESRNLINRARTLLLQTFNYAQAAKELLASGDSLGADQQIMMLQANLPELFLCRDVSDGMGSYILALHYSIKNRRGAALNLDQAFAVYKGLACISDNIFMDFGRSLDLIDWLAASGLVVEPPEVSALAELLAD